MHVLNNPRFRFREDEIARILHVWATGQSVLLTGIRRTGKSEVLKAALYRLSCTGQSVAYLDLQDQNSLPGFYQDLLRALVDNLPASLAERLKESLHAVTSLPSKLSNWVRGQIRHVSVPDVLDVELAAPDAELVRYWTPLAEQIGIILSEHADELPVIGLDELPFMLENLIASGVRNQELVIALASLRKLRDAGLRFGIAGSISFENLLTLHGIPHTVLGGLSRQYIPPFSRDEGAAYLSEFLRGQPAAAPDVIKSVLDALPDYVPEFLRICETQLYPCRNGSACETAMQQQVLPAIRRAFLNQFDERLNKNYAAELNTAQRILDGIAQADSRGARLDGTRLPADYRQVLLKLEYDNFLVEGEDFKWRFSLNLIRLWWRAQRGMS
jgi:hypothetical protein